MEAAASASATPFADSWAAISALAAHGAETAADDDDGEAACEATT